MHDTGLVCHPAVTPTCAPPHSLQTKADPPIPALRLLFLVSLLALAFLAVLNALSWAVAAMQRWRRQQRTAVATPGKGQREQADDIEAGSVVGLPEASPQKEGGASTGGSAAKLDKAACSEGATAADDAAAAAAVERRAARPEVPLERGLSRKLRGLEQRHPTAHRWLACLSIAVSMALAGGAQVVAPGMVDAAIGACGAALWGVLGPAAASARARQGCAQCARATPACLTKRQLEALTFGPKCTGRAAPPPPELTRPTPATLPPLQSSWLIRSECCW